MLRFKTGERELKAVPTAGALQAHGSILCAEGTVGFQPVLLSDGFYVRGEGSCVQICLVAIDRDLVSGSQPMRPLSCCLPFSRQGHHRLALLSTADLGTPE